MPDFCNLYSVKKATPLRGRWGEGERGRWGDGETRRRGDGEKFYKRLAISLHWRLPQLIN
ncbi:MAG: hypothetical protein F6K58_11590 [Symploca sp. SIO2E9]|nr:hypothetical protein [Symploca sp. SIO2E9]